MPISVERALRLRRGLGGPMADIAANVTRYGTGRILCGKRRHNRRLLVA